MLTRGRYGRRARCCSSSRRRARRRCRNWFAQDDISIVPGRFNAHRRHEVRAQRLHRLRVPADRAAALDAGDAARRSGRGVSRAVRMPTRFDSDLRFTAPAPFVVLRGNPAFRVRERGLARGRLSPGDRFRGCRVDVAGFVNTYDDLRTQEPTPPTGFPIVLMNNLNARTAGVETTVAVSGDARRAAARAATPISTSGSRLDPGSRDRPTGTAEHNDPANQFRLRVVHESARVVRSRRGPPRSSTSFRIRSSPATRS